MALTFRMRTLATSPMIWKARILQQSQQRRQQATRMQINQRQ